MLKAVKGDDFIRKVNDAMAIKGSEFDENRFQVEIETLQKYCTNLDGNTGFQTVADTLRNLKV